MSSTRTSPWRPAMASARRLAASTWGVDKWVPVMTRLRHCARKSSLIASASSAISAQFSRANSSGNVSWSLMPSSTMPVSRSRSICTWLVSQPSRRSVSVRKRPFCSSPTREIMAERSPRRAVPKAMLPEEPPRYLAKLLASSRLQPICCAYRSTARRPRQATSSGRSEGKFSMLMVIGPCVARGPGRAGLPIIVAFVRS